jgi:ribonuclease P protein component
MQRHHRLTGSARISEIHNQGRSAANALLVVRLSPNGLDRSRFCFVASKRVGNAVVRNRVKRRLREVMRKGAGAANYVQLESAAQNLMRRTKLVARESPQ